MIPILKIKTHFLTTLASLIIIGGTASSQSEFVKFSTGTSEELTGQYIFSGKSMIVTGAKGTMIRTKDGGESWSNIITGVTVDFREISFPTPTTGYAVGQQQTILKTTDGGDTWLKIPFETTRHNFYGVHFLNNATGLAVTGNGKILRTTNGAVTWDTVYKNQDLFFTSLDFLDEQIGFATAGGGGRDNGYGLLLKTSDAGKSWAPVNLRVPATLAAAFMQSVTTIYTVGYDGLICKSQDGGETWNIINIPGVRAFRDITFLDKNTGYVVGYGGNIYTTVDGGINWTNMLSPVTTDLYTIGIKDNKIFITGEAGVMLKK